MAAGIVATAVLGQDQLVVDPLGLQPPHQRGDLGGQTLGLVVDGDDDGEARRRLHGAASPHWVRHRCRSDRALRRRGGVPASAGLLYSGVPEGEVPAAQEVPGYRDHGGGKRLEPCASAVEPESSQMPRTVNTTTFTSKRRQVDGEEDGELALALRRLARRRTSSTCSRRSCCRCPGRTRSPWPPCAACRGSDRAGRRHPYRRPC